MLRTLWLGAAAWAAAAGWVLAEPAAPAPAPAPAPLAAAPADVKGPLPLDAFFAKPSLMGPQISPSGRYLATIEKHGEGQAVWVTDRQTGARKMVTFSSTDHVGFDWVDWKGDDKLLMKTWLFQLYRANNKPKGAILGARWGSFLESSDREGKNVVVMFQNNAGRVKRSAAAVTLLDKLRGDPGHALVAAPDARGISSVWKVDLETGVGELREVGDWYTTAWGVDVQGNVVARTEVRDHSLVIEGRDAAGWSEVVRIRPKELKGLADFELLGPASQPSQFYVAVRAEQAGATDGRLLRIYDFKTRTLGEVQWPALKYDIANIVYRGDTSELAGVCYVVDVYTCSFKDKVVQSRYDRWQAFFHGERNLVPVSMSDDAKQWIVAVSGPDEPAACYLFNMDSKSVERLGDRTPELVKPKLGKMRRFSYKSRDGADIPAYLTLPPEAPKGPAPLVVMPHGGPETRDSYDYDALGQYLATRGYLVFQPNFRGSGGYGLGYAQAGYGQWGGRMADDVTDGVNALIDQGQADPKRICIVGGSYGGYAALQAGAAHPELYKCVVSWDGVADLNAIMRWEKKHSGGADTAQYKYWLKSIGDPVADKDRLAKASPTSFAASYQPAVLMFHGEDDDVVPLEQSKLMEEALKKAGKDVKLEVFKDEGHGNFSDDNAKKAFTELSDFLDRHIGSPRP